MKRILLYLISLYQDFKRTYFKSHIGCCKFYPSCSKYAYQAISKYGALKGLMLAIWRILRCNPFSKGGYDPLK